MARSTILPTQNIQYGVSYNMKANNGRGNNPLRDEWETPQEIYVLLDSQYHFSIDCCATNENTKCTVYPEDFLKTENMFLKDHVAWMNPPFSLAYKMFRHYFSMVDKGVSIYRCDNMETRVWQKEILPNCSWIFVPDKRISYDGLDGDGARFPSALIGINVPPPNNIRGVLLEVKR